ncbi:SDR family NAD(P)-dependent oxidoreductase [Streptomyces sp. VRA16 Mangrove soil]|uniref:SDR family NAD(P)-dependent oxidoreductase n=1 Tax=Streptomyces sp. VRA16 Mangrove soil TaxID=2817434 RepID=UPI001A9F5C33|nr:SDR family NAD(P)-dependent oxidoreductase [Streptomyces sp. VRA16 Mangrove soil]MBO1332968.1 SDR family oxidoreductase [Streptomyces sp. VRA16 Mangrove soil]
MSSDLQGSRALVTGAGHGIGRAIAVALAAAGCDVAVHYRGSAEEAGRTVAAIEELGRRAKAFQADVTVTAEVDGLVADTVGFLGGLDVLVCNAGHLIGRATVAEMSDEHFDRVIDANLTSTFRTCRAALPHLSASPAGRIVTMSSLAAHNGGGPGSVAYAAAKAGIRGFTKALAKEVAGAGVTVNAVAPGFIKGTAFHDTFTAPEAQEAMAAGIPVGRPGTPEDVAASVVHLASPAAGFLTGTTLDIDGGVWPR